MAKYIYSSPYKPQAISKQTANASGWQTVSKEEPGYHEQNIETAIWTKCPICNGIYKTKRLQKHLDKIHPNRCSK